MERSLYEESIRSILPKLDPSTLTKVLDHLDHLGYADYFSWRGDVEETDLRPFMKEGHIKILLKNWKGPNPEAGPQTRDVAGPSGACARSAAEYQDRGKLEARRIEKNECKLKSTVVKSEGKTEIRQLQMTEEATSDKTGHRHLSFGHAYPPKEMKVVLLVGQTGAGKSTLIDAFANHLLGVELEDDYRFRVTKSETDPSQAHRQTQSITAYTFYHQVTFPDEFPYNLMIVDTPGFGDRGIAEDKKIERKLKLFFTPDEPGGIGVLHAVGLVVKSSETVLSPTLKYLFDSMLAPFGKDIRENIFLLTTFSDGLIPLVLKVAKEDKLPYTEFFKFNNSYLFAYCSELRGADKTLCRSTWSMVETSYHAFLNAITKATPKRLKQTNEVLTERENVETHISTLHEKINITLRDAEVLHTNIERFAKHQDEIERTEDFIIEVKKIKKCRIPLKKGEYALNCVKCQLTCHYPCTIDNHLKFRCKRMDTSTRKCTFCPGGCAVKEHEHVNEKIVIGDEMIAESAQNIINKYEKACKEKLTCEKVISKIIEDVEVIDTEVVTLVDDVRQSLDKLNEIALRPDLGITTAEYIDILIKYEERQRNADWQDRVDHLSAVRERALRIKNFADTNGITEPLEKVKREILQIKADREAGRGESRPWIIASVSVTKEGGWKEKRNKMLREIYQAQNLIGASKKS